MPKNESLAEIKFQVKELNKDTDENKKAMSKLVDEQNELTIEQKLSGQKIDTGFDTLTKKMDAIESGHAESWKLIQNELSTINKNQAKMSNAMVKLATLHTDLREVKNDVKENTKKINNLDTSIKENDVKIKDVKTEFLNKCDETNRLIEDNEEKTKSIGDKLDKLSESIEAINGLKYSGKTVIFILGLIATIVTIASYFTRSL